MELINSQQYHKSYIKAIFG